MAHHIYFASVPHTHTQSQARDRAHKFAGATICIRMSVSAVIHSHIRKTNVNNKFSWNLAAVDIVRAEWNGWEECSAHVIRFGIATFHFDKSNKKNKHAKLQVSNICKYYTFIWKNNWILSDDSRMSTVNTLSNRVTHPKKYENYTKTNGRMGEEPLI